MSLEDVWNNNHKKNKTRAILRLLYPPPSACENFRLAVLTPVVGWGLRATACRRLVLVKTLEVDRVWNRIRGERGEEGGWLDVLKISGNEV